MAQKTKITTGLVRFSYVHLFEPHAFNEGEKAKYSMTILIPKTDKATLARIKAAQQAAVQEGISKVFGGKKPKNLYNTLRDGDEQEDKGPEVEGNFFMNVTTNHKPQVVDANLQAVLDPEEVYSGCFGRVSLTFSAYNHAGKRGVSAYLNNVQKLKDGEHLGGGSSAEDDFGDDFAEDYADDFGDDEGDLFDL